MWWSSPTLISQIASTPSADLTQHHTFPCLPSFKWTDKLNYFFSSPCWRRLCYTIARGVSQKDFTFLTGKTCPFPLSPFSCTGYGFNVCAPSNQAENVIWQGEAQPQWERVLQWEVGQLWLARAIPEQFTQASRDTTLILNKFSWIQATVCSIQYPLPTLSLWEKEDLAVAFRRPLGEQESMQFFVCLVPCPFLDSPLLSSFYFLQTNYYPLIINQLLTNKYPFVFHREVKIMMTFFFFAIIKCT